MLLALGGLAVLLVAGAAPGPARAMAPAPTAAIARRWRHELHVLIAAILVLAVGTYASGWPASSCATGSTCPTGSQRLLPMAAAALLAALAGTAALIDRAGASPASPARPASLVGALLAWRRAPFVVVVVGAAATAALLRLAGVP